jgi:hypothetical protein
MEPELENRFAGKELDRAVLRDLSTLSEDNAMVVGRHLEAASFYAEVDAPRALQHAIAAKNRASRLAIVRETVGIMAYVNQDFTLALAELRTAQRISGSNDQIALIIDCLRGLDRSNEGLKIARELDRESLPREAQIDLAIVLSGIRLDRDETDRAYAELQIPHLDPTNATPECVALFDANAEVLEEMGRADEGVGSTPRSLLNVEIRASTNRSCSRTRTTEKARAWWRRDTPRWAGGSGSSGRGIR